MLYYRVSRRSIRSFILVLMMSAGFLLPSIAFIPMAQQGQEGASDLTIVFQDDFEGRDLSAWSVDETWAIEQVDGNHVLHGEVPAVGHAQATPKEVSVLADYTLEVRLQLVRGDMSIFFRNRYELGFYDITVRENHVVLAKEQHGNHQPLTDVDVPLRNGQWATLRIRGEGPQLTISLDGQDVLTFTDPEPFLTGGVAFENRGHLHLDDIKVLTLREALLAPRREPVFNWEDPQPPLATRISLEPQGDGWYTQVRGRAGAVPGGSAVLVSGLDSGHSVFTRAVSDGSFSVTVIAPPGSFVQIKYDEPGRHLYPSIVNEPGLVHEVNFPPGTILRVPVGDMTNVGQFVTAGFQPFVTIPWQAEGQADASTLFPGGTWDASGTVRLFLPVSLGRDPTTVQFHVLLDRFFDETGRVRWRLNNFMSVLMTPTGFPIERNGGIVPTGAGGRLTGLRRLDSQTVEGRFSVAIQLPANLPPGLYRPELSVEIPDITLRKPVVGTLEIFSLIKEFGSGYLPPVQVGQIERSKLIWALLTDTFSQGTRGTVALEDRGRFGISSKIIHQGERFIIPMVESGTSEPITYRLEPFLPMIANADRGLPNSPTISFKYPSGSLQVTVRKPDGTVDDLGQAPFVQSRNASPMTSTGVLPDNGGGNLGDVYQLTTLDKRFRYRFSQYGRHEIIMTGTIEDVYGTIYEGGGTYEVYVAKTLDIKPGLIPTTPFEVGDAFAPSVTIYPGVPAEIETRYRLYVNSSETNIVERVISGQANRFGYFYPGMEGEPLIISAPGEYRVDVTARYQEPDGTLWMGSLSWGQVVETPDTPLIAHGRHGIDAMSKIGPAWFTRRETSVPIGGNHINFPYYHGDILWQTDDDAAQVRASIEDTQGQIASLLAQRARTSAPCIEGPPREPEVDVFRARAAAQELPLFSATQSGWAPNFDDRIVQWGYFYGSAVRPDVSVRQMVSEDCTFTSYWRFEELYALQIGMGVEGDLPNDLKFQYVGAVFRDETLGIAQYAIYGSLWVGIPEDDEWGGSRVFPPFRLKVDGREGGYILEIEREDGEEEEVDLLIVPTGTRPGAVLEVGDVFSFSGNIAPTLPVHVEVEVTTPSGRVRCISGEANKIGYFYDPGCDFVVTEPGLYRVHVALRYEGMTSAGLAQPPFNTGSVLGAREGAYHFYVVPRETPLLMTELPPLSFVMGTGPVEIPLVVPQGLSEVEVRYTIQMPGWVLEEEVLWPEGESFTVVYDPVRLHEAFPNIDLQARHNFEPGLADEILISLLLVGEDSDGQKVYQAKHISLLGADLLLMN